MKHKKIKIELARTYWKKERKKRKEKESTIFTNNSNSKGRNIVVQSSDTIKNVTHTIKNVNYT